MLTVVDHTEPRWYANYRVHGRENGAKTYSEDIVQYHIPLYRTVAEERDITVGTCGRMLHTELTGDVAVQYLHEYRYKEGTANFHLVNKQLRNKFGRVIFVTAYKSLAVQAEAEGFEVWHIPMAVDVSRITPVLSTPQEHRGIKAAAYFGNLISGKAKSYRDFERTFRDNGWSLTPVSGTQRDCWHELTKFDYVVAVGRCALEAGALGRKVMVFGAEFGGIVTNETERQIQLDTNCNGRVVTFDREIASCLDSWDSAIPFTNDVSAVTQTLAGYLAALDS